MGAAGVRGRAGIACPVAATRATWWNVPTGERTTPASKLTLVPLERLRDTINQSFAVSPPWRKDVYSIPESDSS